MSAPVHVVQLHMKIGTADLAKHIKEIKVRAHVVLKLGYDLIRAGHAAYVEVKFSRTGIFIWLLTEVPKSGLTLT